MDVCPTFHHTSTANATNGEKSLCIRMLGKNRILYTENCGTTRASKWDIDKITFLDLKLSRDCFNNLEFKKFVELYLKEGPQDKILHVCNDNINEPLLYLNEWDVFCNLLIFLGHSKNKINMHLEIFNLDYNKTAEHVFCSNQLKKIDFSKFRQIDYFHVLSDNESYHYPTFSEFYIENLELSLDQWSKNYLDDPILAQERFINQKGIRHDPKADRIPVN